MMATWLKFLGTTFLAATLATACEITVSDDDDGWDDDDSWWEGGSENGSGRAGASQAGRAGAGRGGTGGSGGTAGRAGSGGGGAATAGSGGANTPNPYEGLSCESDDPGTVPAASCEFQDPAAEDVECLSCLSASCCDELKSCYAEDPHDRCGYGVSAEGTEEYVCYMDCLVDFATASPTKFWDSDDQMTCALRCGMAVDADGQTCAVPLIGDRTNDLLSCMHVNCEYECLIARIPTE